MTETNESVVLQYLTDDYAWIDYGRDTEAQVRSYINGHEPGRWRGVDWIDKSTVVVEPTRKCDVDGCANRAIFLVRIEESAVPARHTHEERAADLEAAQWTILADDREAVRKTHARLRESEGVVRDAPMCANHASEYPDRRRTLERSGVSWEPGVGYVEDKPKHVALAEKVRRVARSLSDDEWIAMRDMLRGIERDEQRSRLL